MEIAYSINNVPIRFTYERWFHITENHDDLASYYHDVNEITSEDFVKRCMTMVSDFVKLPVERLWIDYDKEADVLYLSFRKPQRAKKTIETDDDILIRKDGENIVGITILDASTR